MGRVIDWDPIRQELRSVADQASVMVWLTEPDGYCIYLNKNWYEFTGQTFGDAEGNGWNQAVHPDDRELALAAFLQATRLRMPYHVEYRLRRHDGEYVWVVAAGHPYFNTNGSIHGYIGSDSTYKSLSAARSRPSKVLSPREREIISWIAGGKTSGEIATILGIAARTVEQHVQSASLKLSTINRVQTVVEAIRRGELEI